ncbi:hypothetical protein LPUS_08362 [Lasallia pustulata]|uniref:Uncharacterized protein n=1 Tax=Lasallia pustulata TaxID=136370 RepID=A0A1W5D5N7_9LECA|nr:hypothetical protein LPUS_08362 [Lasallia pustulata]
MQVRSQNEIVKSTLQQFQNLLLGLFEAHDALESGSFTEQENSEYFEPSDNDQTRYHLRRPILERFTLITKQLVGYGALNDISVDDLRRLQHICEGPIEIAQTINLKIEDDASERELSQWHAQMRNAEIGILTTPSSCPKTA